MKVTITLTDLQLMKALALTPVTEGVYENVMAIIRETPEVDVTEAIKDQDNYSQFASLLGVMAIVVIASERDIDLATASSSTSPNL